MLEGESKIYKPRKAKSLVLTIPASIATDSQFGFKQGDRVFVTYEKGKDDFGNNGEGLAVLTIKRIDGICFHCKQPITPDQERTTDGSAEFHEGCF